MHPAKRVVPLHPRAALTQDISMTVFSSGHWYPVLSSRQLRKHPVARTRFGERLVFWRTRSGDAVCMPDRCAHRGAALSLGRVSDDAIECRFHGFRFGAAGQCLRVPAEGDDWEIPDQLRVPTRPVREADGYLWSWRGPAAAAADLPPLPRADLVKDMHFGEVSYLWNAHYTRAIENVLDYSHLPFVHRRSIGAFIRDPRTRVRVESRDGGFLFFLDKQRKNDRQYVDFVYPTLWFNRVGRTFVLAATFMPVDDQRTEVYVRWYHRVPRPLHPLVDLWGRFAQFLVFDDDLPIVASQQPANVDDAGGDRLVPSDAGVVAYRKLRRSHQQELRQEPRESRPAC